MVTPLRERVCREQNERDQNDGCEEGDGRTAANVPAELVVVVANFVPAGVRVPLQPEIGNADGCSGCRCHDPYHQLQEKFTTYQN